VQIAVEKSTGTSAVTAAMFGPLVTDMIGTGVGEIQERNQDEEGSEPPESSCKDRQLTSGVHYKSESPEDEGANDTQSLVVATANWAVATRPLVIMTTSNDTADENTVEQTVTNTLAPLLVMHEGAANTTTLDGTADKEIDAGSLMKFVELNAPAGETSNSWSYSRRTLLVMDNTTDITENPKVEMPGRQQGMRLQHHS
jgi:hypothetical protein